MIDIFRNGVEHVVASDDRDLTLRQIAVFLEVMMEEDQPTVRGMAAKFDVAKPAVTRAIDRLEELEFVKRVPDGNDRRSVRVAPTTGGRAYFEALKAAIVPQGTRENAA